MAKAAATSTESGLGLVGAAGSRDLPGPSMDTEYTLVATNDGGETRGQAQVKVVISGAPRVMSFTVQSSELVKGQRVVGEPMCGTLAPTSA